MSCEKLNDSDQVCAVQPYGIKSLLYEHDFQKELRTIQYVPVKTVMDK